MPVDGDDGRIHVGEVLDVSLRTEMENRKAPRVLSKDQEIMQIQEKEASVSAIFAFCSALLARKLLCLHITVSLDKTRLEHTHQDSSKASRSPTGAGSIVQAFSTGTEASGLSTSVSTAT